MNQFNMEFHGLNICNCYCKNFVSMIALEMATGCLYWAMITYDTISLLHLTIVEKGSKCYEVLLYA